MGPCYDMNSQFTSLAVARVTSRYFTNIKNKFPEKENIISKIP